MGTEADTIKLSNLVTKVGYALEEMRLQVRRPRRGCYMLIPEREADGLH